MIWSRAANSYVSSLFLVIAISELASVLSFLNIDSDQIH